MKNIRFSVIITGDAAASIIWYHGLSPCHYVKTDIHMDTLMPGTYDVTIAAHLHANTTITLVIDDITNLQNPSTLYKQAFQTTAVQFSHSYVVHP